jgi:hypothetical protein
LQRHHFPRKATMDAKRLLARGAAGVTITGDDAAPAE